MHKLFLQTAALLGALSVALGAFAAHGLKKRLPAEAIAIFETGVRYQFYHVFALALTALVWKECRNGWVSAAGLLFLAGIILFSGSLYALAGAWNQGPAWSKVLGPVTPLGGLLLLAGWISLCMGISR